MINANVVIEKAQEVNRKNWLNHASNILSEKFTDAANLGLRRICIPFNDIVRGAEDLAEAAEMCYLLCMELEDKGYKNTIQLDGNLYISW